MKISKGRVSKPHLVLIYGKDGVGKSSWAAHAPNPLYIDLERSTLNLEVGRVDAVEKYTEVVETIKELTANPQGYKTLVIDTIDWLDAALQKQICGKSKVKSLARAAGGYGAGAQELGTYWKGFQRYVNELQTKTGMNVVFICHSHARDFNDPATEAPYARYELKLYEDKQVSIRALFREWCDSVLFLHDEVAFDKEAVKGRGYATGKKVVYTVGTPAWDAKSRFRLPEELPFPDPATTDHTGFKLYADATGGEKAAAPAAAAVAVTDVEGDDDADVVKARVRELYKECNDSALKMTISERMKIAGNDLTKLKKIESQFNAAMGV